MNTIDLLAAGVLIGYGVVGYLQGFIKSFGALLGVASTLAATWFACPRITDLLSGLMPKAPAQAVGLIGAMILFHFVFTLGFQFAHRRIPETVRKSGMNRAFGVLPGLLDGAVMLALLLTLSVSLPIHLLPYETVERSRIGRPLLDAGEAAQATALDLFGSALRSLVGDRTIEPEPGRSVDLPFRSTNGKADSDLERDMLIRVNHERTSRGLKALAWDDRLRDIARGHSTDMLARGYFSHHTPEGKTVADRMKARRLDYMLVGENLALAPTLKLAHEGLMESPGHRANILGKDYVRVGIGIIVARPHGLMVTQVLVK